MLQIIFDRKFSKNKHFFNEGFKLFFIFLLILFTTCANDNIYKNHPKWQYNYILYKSYKSLYRENKNYVLDFKSGDTILDTKKLMNKEIAIFHNSKLSVISEEIKKNKSLKCLILNGTNLKSFPQVIFEMPQLIRLDFAFSCNTDRNDSFIEFKKLRNLELLSLSSCSLNDLPEPITELHRLKYLNLSQNKIGDFSCKVGKLDSLIELNLSWNKIQILPKEIANLCFLEILNLSCNKITSFPFVITSLYKLQEIDLSNNDIKELPVEILNLKNLRTINLMSNSKFHLSKEFAIKLKKHLPYLEEIDLVGTFHSDKEIKELMTIPKLKIIFHVFCGTNTYNN